MTIKDIARECGCGVGTVSRVLNKRTDVSDQMREKVLEVVNKYGFILNQNAKQLKELDRKTIVILVKGMSSLLFNALLEIIQQKVQALSYTTSVVVLDEYDNEAKVACRLYYEQKRVGIIFLGGTPDTFKEDFAKIQSPCVLITNGAKYVNNALLSSITTDDTKASYDATSYLIRKGHKKIGVIGGDLKSSELTKRRYRGFLKAMKEAGLAFNVKKNYSVSKYSFEGGEAATGDLLEKYPDLTAIFTMSDVMAVGACRFLKNIGQSVPEDVSVTGFDGLSLASYYCPKITTIKQLSDRLAIEGLDLLLKCIEKKEKAKHIILPFEFIEGESVKDLNPENL